MKKHFFWLVLFTAFFCTHNLLAQKLVVKTDSGRIDGADYKILFPANWKGKLVMYAHGYEVRGIVQKFSKGPFFSSSVNPFLERGFAVAASDYSSQGFAYEQGVNDTEALRKYFVKKYGKPDSTFIAGGSMGGAVALAAIEKFGKNYNGGLPLCPMAGTIYASMNRFFDYLVTFNALFPGIEPSLSDIFSSTRRDTLVKPMTTAQLFSRLDQIKKAVIIKDSTLAVAYGNRLEVKLNDLPFVVFFAESVVRDIAQRANGNPFDNTNTVYRGFPDDGEINKKVERLPATVDPKTLFDAYDRTGNINQPIVVVQTLYDQLSPGSVVTNYENMVRMQSKMQNLTVYYTNGEGHCNFTAKQTGQAFDELRSWLKTGTKPKPGPMN